MAQRPLKAAEGARFGPAFALLELESIAAGYQVSDALLKKADVDLWVADAVSPGKFLVGFFGSEAHVEESFAMGLEAAGDTVLDRVLLTQMAAGLRQAFEGKLSEARPGDALGIVETHTVPAAILSADAALKGADVMLVDLHLATGIGGKAYHFVSGMLADVEAAIDASVHAIAAPLLARTEVIARPHQSLHRRALPLFR